MSAIHEISLAQAIEMTTLYRKNKQEIIADKFKSQQILSICETFDRSIFDTILGQTDCKSIRIYQGMGEDLKMHSIIVGVNSKGEDMLPTMNLMNVEGDPVIGEDSQVCPPNCPPTSPLNK